MMRERIFWAGIYKFSQLLSFLKLLFYRQGLTAGVNLSLFSHLNPWPGTSSTKQQPTWASPGLHGVNPPLLYQGWPLGKAFVHLLELVCFLRKTLLRRSQDGGGIGWGDHFLSYKFIERTIKRWTKFTKQFLITSSGHQAPRKAAHCLRRKVGQKY